MPPKKAKKAVKKAVKPGASPQKEQAQAQQQTVIVNVAEAKKITRRRRKAKAKGASPDAYSLARPVAVYQTSQSSQANQLFDTIRVMNSLLEQKASMPLVMPVQSVPEQNYTRLRWGAEPIPEEPTATRVAKAVQRVAEQTGDVAGAVGAVAGAVEQTAEATGQVVEAGRAVQGAVETIKEKPAKPQPQPQPQQYTADWPERLPSHDEMNRIINENSDAFKGEKTRTKALSQTRKFAVLRSRGLL